MFDELLNSASNSFDDWHYIYEKRETGIHSSRTGRVYSTAHLSTFSICSRVRFRNGISGAGT